MESSKVPFITVNPSLRPPQRELKPWRPLSTRPWILLLFLAATGVCFGLLVAVSLTEKQTSLNPKRDLDGSPQRRDVVRRQADTTSVTTSGNESSNSLLSLSSSSTRTAVATLTSAASEQLSLTSQCYFTSAVTVTTYTATVGQGTPVSETSLEPTSSYTGTCSVLYETVVDSQILSLTSQTTVYSTTTATSAILSLTSAEASATSEGLSLTAQDEPTSATSETSLATGSPVSSEVLSLTSEGLSLTAQDVPASATSETPSTTKAPVSQISDDGQLSLTAQVAAASDSTHSSESSYSSSLSSAASSQLSLTNGLSLTEQPSTSPAVSGSTSKSDAPESPSTIVYATTSMLSLAGKSSQSSAKSSTPTSTGASYSASNYLYLTTETDANGIPITTFTVTASSGAVTSFTSYSLSTVLSTTAYMTTEFDTNGKVLSTFMTTETSSSVLSFASIVVESAGGTTYLSVSNSAGQISGTSNNGRGSSTITGMVTSTHSLASLTAGSGSAAQTTSANGTDTVDPEVNENFVLIKTEWENSDYFLAVYLPKIIAVIMACLWSIIFAGLKLSEPMYQLSADSGAFAMESMFGNYLSSELTPSSLTAILRGQWVLILGCILLVAWASVVALISESMTIISTGTCSTPEIPSFRCDPRWAVRLPVLKIVMALVALIFILTAILTYIIIRRKRSGMFSDPSSIAAMAELLGNPAVLHDFREIDPAASEAQVRRLLGQNRYKLGFYDTATSKEVHPGTIEPCEQRWGLIKIAGHMPPQQLGAGGLAKYGAISSPALTLVEEAKTSKRRRRYQLLYDAVMLLTSLVIFGLVLGYYLDAKSDPLNDFFNSQGFGPRFVLTGLALILSTGWRISSQEVTLMAPYRSMARAFNMSSGVTGKRSILAETASTPFTAFHKGLFLRDYVIAAVAMSAILSEVLLVAVSGVPFSSGQIKPSLQASSFVSLAILFIMLVTSIAVIVHNRISAGGTRRLPRSPDTLVGVWLYLCGSELAQHNGWDDHDSVALDRRGLVAKYEAGHYAFARAIGVDGITRWTIDEAAELQCSKPEVVHSAMLESKRPRMQQMEIVQEELSEDDLEEEQEEEQREQRQQRQQHQKHQQQQQRPYQLEWPPPSINPQVYTPSIYSVESGGYQQSIPPVRDRFELHHTNTNGSDRNPRQQPRQQLPRPQDFYPPPTAREYFIEAEGRSPTPHSHRRFESLRSRSDGMQRESSTTSSQAAPLPQQHPSSWQWTHWTQTGQHYYEPPPSRPNMSDRSRMTGRAADPYQHTKYRQVGK